MLRKIDQFAFSRTICCIYTTYCSAECELINFPQHFPFCQIFNRSTTTSTPITSSSTPLFSRPHSTSDFSSFPTVSPSLPLSENETSNPAGSSSTTAFNRRRLSDLDNSSSDVLDDERDSSQRSIPQPFESSQSGGNCSGCKRYTTDKCSEGRKSSRNDWGQCNFLPFP